MNYLPAICLAFVTLMLAGCADPEDRAFFGTGWVHPESGANQRLEKPQTLAPVRNDYDPSPMKSAQ